jgi:putative hydrolase of the HAD superfamily
MHPVRLAAPDLAGHLVYAPDREFAGPVVDSLTGAVRLLDPQVPAGGGVPASRGLAGVTSPP